jgi:PAS domain S-box-containing protein
VTSAQNKNITIGVTAHASSGRVAFAHPPNRASMADASVVRPDLSLVLERITDGFLALDAEWRVTYINSEARRLLHALDEVVGKRYLDVFPRARGTLFEQEYARAMREQRSVQFVEYSGTADCWFEVKAYPSTDGLSVYFRDVTQRVKAEHEVERTARLQQAMLDLGNRALGDTPYEQLLLHAKELVRQNLEVEAVEFSDYHGRLECDAERDGLAAVLCVPIGTLEHPFGVFAVYHREARVFSPSEVRFVHGVAHTLAETAAAAESNRRMLQVIESTNDAFLALDRELRITYANRRMAALFRVEPEDAIGSPLSRFTSPLREGAAALAHYDEALHTGKPVAFETLVSSQWFETRIYPFAGGIAAYVRDVTQQKSEQERMVALNAQLERRVAARTAQLEFANRELESFSYSVSHDLRAPLRAIDGFSAALVEEYESELDDRARGYLSRVRAAARRMSDLIDALLDLARVARAPIAFVEVDLSRLAGAVVDELREHEPDRAIHVEIAPGLRAAGEPKLVAVVLQNLIGNAWKFTRHTERPRVEVGRTFEGEFFVRDNGAGFEMAYVKKLFGAFARLHSADDYEGTGIGLATVARIVHRHGGTIRAEGHVGKGATFTFTLPAAKGVQR